ncbi:MAG: hypothetical protein IPH31_22385 [Lewinellaceae bacterium]|nr:hypothetical protein [Lewinellaceae bacterium]
MKLEPVPGFRHLRVHPQQFERLLGQLGLVIYDTNLVGNVLSVPDNDTLFQVCFDVVGTLGQCTGFNITNNPTGVAFEDAMGQTIALTADTGSVCIQFQPLNVQIAIIDSTCLGLGTMVVTATGGESPYQVIVHEFATGYDVQRVGNFNNLTYSIMSALPTAMVLPTICDTIAVSIPTLGAQIDFVQMPQL